MAPIARCPVTWHQNRGAGVSDGFSQAVLRLSDLQSALQVRYLTLFHPWEARGTARQLSGSISGQAKEDANSAHQG